MRHFVLCSVAALVNLCPLQLICTFERYLHVPDDIRKIIDKHVDDVLPLIEACEDHKCKTGERVGYFSWLPDYYIKYDIERRINGAAQIDACIKKYHLDLLAVPQKYIYRVKGRGRAINNHNYLVVVPRVIGYKRKSLTVDQVKQLIIVAKNTQFWDFWQDNLHFTPSDKLMFIDTGFDVEKRTEDSKFSYYLEAMERLVRYFKMDDDAFNYLMSDLKNGKRTVPKRFWHPIARCLAKLPRVRA